MSEVEHLEQTVRWPGLLGWYRRQRALAALERLAEGGSVDAVLALWRLSQAGLAPVLDRQRALLERAFAEPGRDDLVELARALNLPEMQQFQARVRVGRPPPVENLVHLGWLIQMLEGPFQAEAAALLSQLPPQGSPPTRAAALLLAGRHDELRDFDPEGNELNLALERAGVFLKTRLRAALRQTGQGSAPGSSLQCEATFARSLEERLNEEDWTWFLTGLERELPGRAARLLSALQARDRAPYELASLQRPKVGQPPLTTLQGTDPVWAPDDSWLTLHRGGNRFLLLRPDGSQSRQLTAWEEAAPKDGAVLAPLRAFSQTGQYLAAVWRGQEFWESYDHMYSGYEDLYGKEVCLWDTVHFGERKRLPLHEDVLDLYPGYDGVLARTRGRLVALHPDGERWRVAATSPLRVDQGRYVLEGTEFYHLEPWRSLGQVPGPAHLVADRLVIQGEPCLLLDVHELNRLASFRSNFRSAAGRPGGPLVLLTGEEIELRDRDTGRLLDRQCLPEGALQLHPRGEHILSWHQGRARLTSVQEAEPWAEWEAPEEPQFSPRGNFLWSPHRGQTLVWPVLAYRRLDELGLADLTRLPVGWEEFLKALIQRRWRHAIQLQDVPLASGTDIELD
ncbi:MAG: hypothetical protein AMXMBFR33_67900 [Candidatus Xenobia bacterium]